jgi:hypothetical protein
MVFSAIGFHIIITAHSPFLNHRFKGFIGFHGLCIDIHFYEFYAQQPYNFALNPCGRYTYRLFPIFLNAMFTANP